MRFRRGKHFQLTLQTRLALLATFYLCALGAVAVCALEWSNPQTLGALPWHGKLLAGFFQGVTPRTAGFNTLDYTLLREPTLLLTLVLMFIGGSPGSTAGGIKTVTFFVLAASAWSMVRGRGELTVFGRRVGVQTVVKAGAVALLSLGVVFASLLLLTLSELSENIALFPLMFETFSAFGTVGLSLNVTPELGALGQLIVILLMYLGRIGPLTFALALVQEPNDTSLKYPEEGVMIG